jgi:hypothetical protein
LEAHELQSVAQSVTVCRLEAIPREGDQAVFSLSR